MAIAGGKRRLELMPEYGGHVLWWRFGLPYGPVAPDDLGLSASLVDDLRRWVDEYEGIIPDTGTSEEEFVEIGRALAARVQDELGDDVEVIYEWDR